MIFLLSIIIFLELLEYIIIFDIILSWLPVLGIRFRPRFIASILEPIYGTIKKVIPTNIGPFEFSAMIVLIIIFFFKGLLYMIFPDLGELILTLGK